MTILHTGKIEYERAIAIDFYLLNVGLARLMNFGYIRQTVMSGLSMLKI